jgi:hypothetical protein
LNTLPCGQQLHGKVSLLKHVMRRKLLLAISLFLVSMVNAPAQNKPVAEVFCGAELNYADVNFTRLYNVLVNLTPGTKVNLGKDWEFAAQAFIPIINSGYDSRYKMVRLNMVNLSKVLRFKEARQYLRVTAGLFGKERYGGDVRWMFPINSWLMVQARLGLTNHWALGFNFEGESESEFGTSDWSFTGMLGVNFWLNSWNTELRLMGGRYLNKDYGVEAEGLRHFKHCSVSIFAQVHEKAPNLYVKKKNWFSGGFRIVMMLPPYKKQQKKVVLRPASNFRLTYNAQSDGYSMRKYTTDPEENERTYPIRIPWGTGNFDE